MKLDGRSIYIRKEIIRIIDVARRGHIGSAFSTVEILRVLYEEILHYKPQNSNWNRRDRFILSKGHGCLALYVILSQLGFFPKKELFKFCAFEGILGGHPQAGKVPGVEWSTGSLGHGLPVGVGIALALRARISNFKFQISKFPKVFVLLGDGECNEGSVWEAAMTAGKYKLDNIFVLIDYNKMMTYGSIDTVQNVEPLAKKWESFGFNVTEADGHDMKALKRAFDRTISVKGKPHSIICHTIKGKGIPSIENVALWHHKAKVSDEEIHSLLDELGFYR